MYDADGDNGNDDGDDGNDNDDHDEKLGGFFIQLLTCVDSTSQENLAA